MCDATCGLLGVWPGPCLRLCFPLSDRGAPLSWALDSIAVSACGCLAGAADLGGGLKPVSL